MGSRTRSAINRSRWTGRNLLGRLPVTTAMPERASIADHSIRAEARQPLLEVDAVGFHSFLRRWSVVWFAGLEGTRSRVRSPVARAVRLGPCWYHICYALPQQIDHRTPLRLAIIGSGMLLSSVFVLLS